MSRQRRIRRNTVLFALAGSGLSAALAGAFAGCSHESVETGTGTGGQSSSSSGGPGVGSPCEPPDELQAGFSGFRIQEESIVVHDYASCGSGICLVNHFQGRVTCPLGQPAAQACNGPADVTSCGPGATCIAAQTLAPACDCDANTPGGCASQCGGVPGLVCDPAQKMCTCTMNAHVDGTDYHCEVADPTCNSPSCPRVLKAYFCHKPGDCQSTDANDPSNNGKDCCVPGTDTPVTAPVCGQCDAASHRNAQDSVYCSCRCAPADGAPPDPNAEFCTCPTGFACQAIRPWLGIGDPSLAGSYCIKSGTAFTSAATCGVVHGYADPAMCSGVGSP